MAKTAMMATTTMTSMRVKPRPGPGETGREGTRGLRNEAHSAASARLHSTGLCPVVTAVSQSAHTMRLLDTAATADALGFERLVPALREMFAAGCEMPSRHVHQVPGPAGGMTVLIMPAWVPGRV